MSIGNTSKLLITLEVEEAQLSIKGDRPFRAGAFLLERNQLRVIGIRSFSGLVDCARRL